MKYIVILGDGMADTPVEALGGKTPLEAANKPHMDYLAAHGELGMAKTVPDGMAPGSDVANLSVRGLHRALAAGGGVHRRGFGGYGCNISCEHRNTLR